MGAATECELASAVDDSSSVDVKGLAAVMYRQHYAEVFRYVRSRVGTLSEAEDLTSDVFCRALSSIRSYRVMRSSALPWLYTIASHRVIDHYRAKRPTGQLEEAALVPDGGEGPVDLAIRRDMVREVWALAEGLPPNQRRALWLRYGEELELREVAQRMGRSVEAVKLLVHRAVRGVRAGLAAREGRPALRVLAPERRPKRRGPLARGIRPVALLSA